MKKITLKVSAGGEVVARPECDEFETVDECVATFGASGVVEMVNAIHQQRVGNKARTDATEEVRKNAAAIAKAAAKGTEALMAELRRQGKLPE